MKQTTNPEDIQDDEHMILYLKGILSEVWDELEYDPTNWNLIRDKVKEAMNA